MKHFKERIAPPRDLDMLRIKIQEELSTTHQVKVVTLEEEVEKYRNMFFNSRRELERTQAEYGQFKDDAQKDRETILTSNKIEKQQLEKCIIKMQVEIDDTRTADELRKISLQKQDIETKL